MILLQFRKKLEGGFDSPHKVMDSLEKLTYSDSSRDGQIAMLFFFFLSQTQVILLYNLIIPYKFHGD